MRNAIYWARAFRGLGTWLVGMAAVVASGGSAGAQNPPPPTPQVPSTIISLRAVGGVSIDADGIINNVEKDRLGRLSAEYSRALHAPPGDLNAPSDLRKVSLRRLDAALADAVKNRKPLDEAMIYLAGLQQIKYLFVYPEEHDIVLAGFGEGWRVDPQGSIVGATTGKPVLLLDDLLVALRSADEASRSGISCSIDPTPQGLERLQTFLNQQGGRIGDNPKATIAGIERSLGPQQVTVGGVPATSHFAHVLVAADYRMKRLAMNFEPSPVRGLPSYLTMASGRGNMMPRWWLEPDYDPLLADAGGLAWELRGSRVKCVTEDSVLGPDGRKQQTGQASPMAQRWADNYTKHYEEIEQRLPIFAELSNVMDLAVVAALVSKERLVERAECSLPTLVGTDALPAAKFEAPRQVDSKASFFKKGSNWIISASGGVLINSWAAAGKTEPDGGALAPVREKAGSDEAATWWWN
ncbi:MAG: DUF1598 domain-containing protein [Pirellulales bacterium]|nr:DUF1598 domain-containing protein [Pirellulales bacterium]